jgi:hypothetical protein
MFGAEVAAAHGDTSLEAIDVRDSATGGTSRLESGGLFLFIGYVLTGSDLPSAKRRTRDGIPGSRGALGSVRRRSVPGLEA